MRKIIFGQPCLGKEEINEVIKTLKSGWIGTGPKCFQFENDFSKYTGAKFSSALNSCTSALHLSLIVAGIKKGDEVITTPMTFNATINSIWHTGAKPVLVDINPNTLNIDSEKIEKVITKKTKAIIPVHFGGLPCEMDKIKKIAKKHKLIIIEDAAHAIGARYKGKMIGNLGNLTCFSFYANKNITTAEGGMLTTNNKKIAEKIKTLRLHGLSGDAWKRYKSKKIIYAETVYPGFKYNMTDIQASLGLWQLKKVERFLKIRERYAKLYDKHLQGIAGIRLQTRPQDIKKNRHALHLYVIILEDKKYRKHRDEIIKKLRAKGIGAAIHYEAIHLHKFYKENLKYKKGDLPIAEFVGRNIISLPLTPTMSKEDALFVAKETKKILNNF